jgi:PAS domain S-box-containing protein
VDIRTKLVFALVAVALGSMLALGTTTYRSVGSLLRESTLDQLDGLAESKEGALEMILAGWRERAALVASRTQLRISLRDHSRQAGGAAADRMGRILQDALDSSNTLSLLAVYDVDGDLVSFAARNQTGPPEASRPPTAEIEYRGARLTAPGAAWVTFAAELSLSGESLGWLVVEFGAAELVELTGHYEGLGETGETMIVVEGEAGPEVLHPVRHSGMEPAQRGEMTSLDNPVTRALAGQEDVFWEGVTDYRGVPVWAATRYIPETGWGLVAKVDDSEERAPILAFRKRLTQLALSLSAFPILLGTLLGLRFAKPIHDLATVADEIRGGALSARAAVNSEDEVGLLARTFNEMADELEQRMTLLHEYRRFFEVSVDMLCIAGTDGFFKRTNPAFEKTLGWSTEQLLSRPFFDLIHPDDVESTQREVGKLAQGITTLSFENRFRCADGTYKRLVWTSYPEPDTGLLYAIAYEVGPRINQSG